MRDDGKRGEAMREIWATYQAAWEDVDAAERLRLLEASVAERGVYADRNALREGRAAILRSRSAVASATLRRPEMLPPAEIEAAVLGVVAASPGANDEQAVQAEIDASPPGP